MCATSIATMDSLVSPVNYVRRGMSIKYAVGNETDGFEWHMYYITKIAKRGKTFVECNILDDDQVSRTLKLRNNDFMTSVQPEMFGWKFETTPINVLVNELWEERKKTKDLLALLRSYSENNIEYIEYDGHRCKKRRGVCIVNDSEEYTDDESVSYEDSTDEVKSSSSSPVPQHQAAPTCKSGWMKLVHLILSMYIILIVYVVLFV